MSDKHCKNCRNMDCKDVGTYVDTCCSQYIAPPTEMEKLKQENKDLRKETKCYEAMKEGVQVRVNDLEQENEELKEERKLKVVAMADACVDTVTEYKKSLTLCREVLGDMQTFFIQTLDKGMDIDLNEWIEIINKALKSIDDVIGNEMMDNKEKK